jgi:hypothetical protein
VLLVLGQLRQVVGVFANLGMGLSEGGLVDGQRSAIERLGLGETIGFPEQGGWADMLKVGAWLVLRKQLDRLQRDLVSPGRRTKLGRLGEPFVAVRRGQSAWHIRIIQYDRCFSGTP